VRNDVIVVVHGGPASGIIVQPPALIAGQSPIQREIWTVVISDAVEELLAGRRAQGGTERLYGITLEKLAVCLDDTHHPLLVDAALSAIDHARGWAYSVGSNALTGGPTEGLEEPLHVLQSAIATRRAIDNAQADGLLKDPRWTRRGIRHASFAKHDSIRFVAAVNVANERGLLSRFHESLFDLSSLPITLGLEEQDETASLQIGMDVEGPEEAESLAIHVMDLLRWRLGLTFLGPDGAPDDGDGIEFDVRRQGDDGPE